MKPTAFPGLIASRLPTSLVCTLLLIAACDSGPMDPAPVVSVQVTPPSITLQTGETRQMSASTLAAGGAALSGRQIVWTSDNDAIAQISTAGVVTARAAGTAKIIATSEGRRGESQITVVAPPPVVAGVTLDRTSGTLQEGDEIQLVATPRDAQGNPIGGLGVQWTSSHPEIARVEPLGKVTAIRAGTATMTVKVHGQIAEATITVSANYPYDLLYSGQLTEGGPHQILVLDLAGGAPRPLIPAGMLPGGPAATGSPMPSPDGSRIAFVFQGAIWLINRDGTGLVRLTSLQSGDGPIAWSPDGQKIAFQRRSTGTHDDIWVMDADGQNAVNLTTDQGGWDQNGPNWSPRLADGSYRIAYSHFEAGIPRIWTMKADGTDKRQITTGGIGDVMPAWSPDGQTIAFVRVGSGTSGIWLVNAAGGSERGLSLTAGMGLQQSPAWSPDGKLIAFSSKYVTPGSETGIYQVHTVWADGSKLARRTASSTDVGMSAWLRRP